AYGVAVFGFGVWMGHDSFIHGFDFLFFGRSYDVDTIIHYEEPTVSRADIDSMKDGVRAIFVCAVGIGLIFAGIRGFLLSLTEPSAQIGSEQADEGKRDPVES
ncbi:MAG: hypothetical protein KDL87_07140, partial [Verrucomicrobiae bacterium]|nr:hypothetical protein [Verrucomicrobiae bacterium]